ncbi:hypothetical protein [Gordonia shandongensis]|uniref:hypothetical protein n=1 Tax=Gordonia shandongensis TaxID=376351 RepID=UPI0003FF9B33|nr:hypothetical protein [Gordonia shandongensis]
MTAAVDELDPTLVGRRLPGAVIAVPRHQAVIADHALYADDDPESGELAHTIWMLVIALRGMGISVDELCALAEKRDDDTLLFGTCSIRQDRPLLVDRRYRSTAVIDDIGRRVTRDGSLLDSITVTVELSDDERPDVAMGSVTSVYLFKRARGSEAGDGDD